MCLSKYEVVLYHFLCWGQEVITVLDCPVEEVKKYYGHSMFISVKNTGSYSIAVRCCQTALKRLTNTACKTTKTV